MFKVGDVVHLKSDLQTAMTITSISNNGDCECVWVNKTDFVIKRFFPVNTLVKKSNSLLSRLNNSNLPSYYPVIGFAEATISSNS